MKVRVGVLWKSACMWDSLYGVASIMSRRNTLGFSDIDQYLIIRRRMKMLLVDATLSGLINELPEMRNLLDRLFLKVEIGKNEDVDFEGYERLGIGAEEISVIHREKKR